MNQADIQKLLGGYATGTLTGEEQQILFEAALNDQELFDALAKEQALRDLLRDPGAKMQLLAALDEPPTRWYELLTRHWRPASAILAMAGISAIAVVTFRRATPQQPVIVAQVSAPPAGPPATESARSVSPIVEPPRAVHALDQERRADTPAGNELKDLKAKAVASVDNARRPEELAKLRQEADELKQKSDKDTRAAAGEAVAPASRAFNSGFRESPAKTGNVSGYLAGIQPVAPAPAAVPPPPPPPSPSNAPKEVAESKPRDSAPGTIGGLGGGGGAAGLGGAPPAQIQMTPGQQGQQGQQSQQPSAQQQQQGRLQDNVQVLASPVVVDGIAMQDARSLFYQNLLPSADGTAQADTKVAGAELARKKAEQEKALQVASATTNATAPAQKALQALDRPTNPGIRYTLLRQTANNQFAPVEGDQLKTGDRVEVQFQPNDDGNIDIRERRTGGEWQNLLSIAVQKRQTYMTHVLRSDTAELQVTFVRHSVSTANGLVRSGAGKGGSSTKRQAAAEATYVVGDPSAQRVTFTIPLTYK